MGLTLEFHLGDAETIVRAYAEEDFDLLDEPGVVEESADLSLHIDPRDLDRLSICMAECSGLSPIALRPHLEVKVDEPDRGVLFVSDAWAEYAGAVPDDCDRVLVEKWCAALAAHWNDPDIKMNEDAVEMVRNLIRLCRRARVAGKTLVHTWVG